MVSKKKISKNEAKITLGSLGKTVGAALDADVIIYDGDIDSPCDNWLNHACQDRKRKDNVLLMIHTHGGSADVAYRLARCLQQNYKRFIIYLNGCCKSAGTLLAIGADELIMPDEGELGPLDVQIQKPDELGEVSSGLTLTNALTTLKPQAFDLWEYFFLQIKTRSGGQITTKSSSEIAAGIVGHLFAPIYAQIDPHRLGEIDRAVRISIEYGTRLDRNLQPDALSKLVANYPSHEFIIDRDEAGSLFRSVREPSEDEAALAAEVDRAVVPTLRKSTPPLAFLDDIIDTVTMTEDGNEPQDNGAGRRVTKAEKPRGRSSDGKAPAVGTGTRSGDIVNTA